jgi:putative transposase
MLIFHERQLVQVLAEFESHYDTHRPHRALEQRPPIDRGEAQRAWPSGSVRRAQILGGLINEYRHAA